MSALKNRAMLATLSVSCWTAQVKDRRATSEVEQAHSAREAGKFQKLLIEKAHMDPLTSFANSIRVRHHAMTLPWMDNGARLLPAKAFMKYRQTMADLKKEYQALVDVFINDYTTKHIPAAQKRLGTLFDADDYPLASDLANKFGVEIDIQPVPEGEDFRVDVGEAERARIQQEIAGKVAEREAAAIRDAWLRVRAVVAGIEARCSAPKAIIRESLIDNAKELVTLLPGLNVNDDPKMAEVCDAITNKLIVEPSRLRISSKVRMQVAQSAREILLMVPA